MIEGISTDKIQSPAKPWQFQPGRSGNPSGRPRGSRNKSTLAALPLTADDLANIEDMEKPALIALIKRASAANWGLFLQTDEQKYRMLLDKLAIFAFTDTKPGHMLAAIELYLNRTEGRPQRAVRKCHNCMAQQQTTMLGVTGGRDTLAELMAEIDGKSAGLPNISKMPDDGL